MDTTPRHPDVACAWHGARCEGRAAPSAHAYRVCTRKRSPRRSRSASAWSGIRAAGPFPVVTHVVASHASAQWQLKVCTVYYICRNAFFCSTSTIIGGFGLVCARSVGRVIRRARCQRAGQRARSERRCRCALAARCRRRLQRAGAWRGPPRSDRSERASPARCERRLKTCKNDEPSAPLPAPPPAHCECCCHFRCERRRCQCAAKNPYMRYSIMVIVDV
jgi:hypothetical protein